ncbi:Nn.00g041620.m01.CDS01 [Neocucurbitaria sp. VM-36]
MTSLENLNSNTWYQVYIGTGTQSLVGTSPFSGSGSRGATFINYTDNSSANQRWQIFQLNSTAWTLRNQEGGPNAWLGTTLSDSENTEGATRSCMERGDVADASVYWTINPWGDGTWYFSNAANGTGYHLQKKDSGIMVMSPNVTAPQNAQRWKFKKITTINNDNYSKINLVGAVVATASTTAPSSTSSTEPSASNPDSSSGLSRGAQAAIGASIGGVALIALIVLGLFLWRRRKQRQMHSYPPHELNDQPLGHENTPMTKYEMNHDGAARHEVPYSAVHEAPRNERPVELPGHVVER